MTPEVLSEAEWRRVHEQAVKSELDPDPAQTSWLPAPESPPAPEKKPRRKPRD